MCRHPGVIAFCRVCLPPLKTAVSGLRSFCYSRGKFAYYEGIMPLLDRVSSAIQWSLPPENPARNVVTFVLFTLVCSGVGCWIGAANNDHALIGVITGLCFSLAASQGIILYYSSVWLSRFAAPEDQASVYTFDDPVRFARRKLEIISRLEPDLLTTRIYAVSTCNLFGRPDGRSPAEVQAVRSVNARLFAELARLAIRSDEGKLSTATVRRKRTGRCEARIDYADPNS